jgi:hypothetical protein
MNSGPPLKYKNNNTGTLKELDPPLPNLKETAGPIKKNT